MGQANVSCVGGCTCEGVTIEGHLPEHHSQTVLTNVEVSTAGAWPLYCRRAPAVQRLHIRRHMVGAGRGELASLPRLVC